MKTSPTSLNRRGFLQATGVLGLSALVGGSSLFASGAPEPRLGRRKFGKTGVEVPVLGLGAMFDTVSIPVILQQCYDNGVLYWDTAATYAKGQSEIGIGLFFEKHPEARKDIFLVTKAKAHSPEEMTRSLDRSLERMKTGCVDLFFVHGIDNISVVDKPEMKAWAEKAKREGKIRFVGFSTHANMEQCMLDTPRLGWIDAIMMTYNYANMGSPEMKRAMEACHEAGVGLTAMKVMALGQRKPAAGAASEALLAPLTDKGFTPGQAKIKAVLENPQLSCACVQMQNLQIFQENFAAATDRKPLAVADREALRRYAEANGNNYCAGCSRRCEAALANAVPVRDVLRYQMYHESYGMTEEARHSLAALPREVLARLDETDFAPAERVCPNRLPLAQLMRQARSLVA